VEGWDGGECDGEREELEGVVDARGLGGRR